METRLSYKQIATIAALILATLALAYVTYRLGQVVLMFVLSVIVAAALREPMLYLRRWRISRGVAILLLYLLVLTVLGVGGFFYSTPLGNELNQASVRFPQLYDVVAREWQNSPSQWQQIVADELPDTSELINQLAENAGSVALQLGGYTYNIANVIILIVAIMTLTFYWLIDEDRFVRLWLTMLPIQQRSIARDTWFDIDRRVGIFVRSESLQFVLTLLLLYVGLRMTGVTYAATWALFGAVAQLIPWVGIPLTLLPVIPMYFTDALPPTIVAAVWIVLVGTLMDRVIEPWFGVQRIVHPIVSVLALMIMGEVAGIFGMIIALPLAATFQSVLSHMLQITTSPRSVTQAAYSSQLQILRDRLAKVEAMPARDAQHRMSLDALARRISGTIDQIERIVTARANAPQQRRMPSSTAAADRTVSPIFRRRTR